MPPWLRNGQTDFDRLYYYKSLSVAVVICATVVNTHTNRFRPVIVLQVSECSSCDLCHCGLSVAVMICATVVNTRTDRFRPVVLLQVSECSSYDLCHRG